MKSKRVGDAERQYWDIITCVQELPLVMVEQEIKTDDREAISHNIAIESECNGKPSGIAITKAVLWIEVLKRYHGLEVWGVRASRLREYMLKDKGDIRWGGGGKTAKLHLYESRVILAHIFTRIDNMKSDVLKKYLLKEYMEHYGNTKRVIL